MRNVSTYQLRPYQQQAVDSVYVHLRDHDDNPVVVIPTGGGKTPVMAQLCTDAVNLWHGRVLILAHVRELIEQTACTLQAMAPQLPMGIYSAGLKRRDSNYAVTVAGIQSVYKRACEFDPFDLVIVDEAHMIPPEGEGMYRQFLKDAHIVNPNIRCVGMTATPFRMTSGLICQQGHFLNSICFEVGVKELIRDGYLCPLRTKAGVEKVDTSVLHIRGGEFVAGEMEDLMDTDSRVLAACAEILEHTRDRHSVLIFASGVTHGRHIQSILTEKHNTECGFVCGDTAAGWRNKLIEDFREGKLKYLCNVNVLTTGFDAPNIDCIAMLRPTMSPGLFYQMAGRGFRMHPSKQDCLVLDFGGNVLRHGPVDALQVSGQNPKNSGDCPAKECPQCNAVIHAAYSICPDCGFVFPPPQKQSHDTRASSAGILSGQPTDTEYPIRSISYSVHTKRDNPDGLRTMRVEYEIGFRQYISEWICFEHSGYARDKAEKWWRQRSPLDVPETTQAAVDIASEGDFLEPTQITVRHIAGEKYDRIIGYQLPHQAEAVIQNPFNDDDIPF